MGIKEELAKIQAAITAAVNDAIAPTQMKRIAGLAEDEIRVRTRLGKGVATPNGPQGAFAPLKPSTIESRKRAKIRGDLSNESSPSKSNLTSTGEMLDSLRGTATGKGKAVVKPTGTRDSGLTNEKLASFHERGTPKMRKRPFMNLSSLQVDRITDEVRRDVLARVKKALTKIR